MTPWPFLALAACALAGCAANHGVQPGPADTVKHAGLATQQPPGCRPNDSAQSRHIGEQGKVIVEALGSTDGKTSDVQVKKSSGYARLDRAAAAFVACAQFVPAEVNGVPSAMRGEYPFTFPLE